MRRSQVDLRSNLYYSGSTCSVCAVSLCHMYYVRSMQTHEFLDHKSLTLAWLLQCCSRADVKALAHCLDLQKLFTTPCFCQHLQTLFLKWLSEPEICQALLEYFLWLPLQHFVHSVTLEVTYSCKKWEKREVQVNQKGMILHSLHLHEVGGFLLYCTDVIRIRFPLYLPLPHFPGLPRNKGWFLFCIDLTIASQAHRKLWCEQQVYNIECSTTQRYLQ